MTYYILISSINKMKNKKRNIYILCAVIVMTMVSILQSIKIQASTALIQMTVSSGVVSIDAAGTLNL
jgi:hypothetical protein